MRKRKKANVLRQWICKTTGPIIRTGPNSLSFSNPSAQHDIYGSRTINVRKSAFYRTLDSGAGALSTHTEIDKSKHAIRRRIMSYAFSENAMRFSEQFVLENVRRFCALIGPGEKEQQGDGWSEPRDLKPWGNWLAYDIMGDLAFGTRLKCLEKPDNRYMAVALTEGTKFAYWVSLETKFPTSPRSRFLKTSTRFLLYFFRLFLDTPVSI